MDFFNPSNNFYTNSKPTSRNPFLAATSNWNEVLLISLLDDKRSNICWALFQDHQTVFRKKWKLCLMTFPSFVGSVWFDKNFSIFRIFKQSTFPRILSLKFEMGSKQTDWVKFILFLHHEFLAFSGFCTRCIFLCYLFFKTCQP